MILEGEIKDVKMSSVSSEVQKLITHKISVVFSSWIINKPENYHKRIHRFHIEHNTPCLRPSPPPKKKTDAHTNTSIFYITIVFDWDDCDTQEKLETMVIQNLGGKQGAFIWSIFLQFLIFNFLWR